MSSPMDADYPIADFDRILRDQRQLDLSPLEIAEILWFAMLQDEDYVAPGSATVVQVTEESQASTDRARSNPRTEQESPPLPSDPETINVVADPPPVSGGGEPQKQAVTPLPIEIPAAVALRNRREIAKELRPLRRKVPSRTRQTIDEEATAIQIAEDRLWSPVVKPEPEQWLELAIVVEITNLVDVWQETIAEFRHLLERHGAFRDVRTWQLQTSEQGKPELFLQTAKGLKGRPRSPRELLDAGGRRLVLLVSDCTSKAWRSGKMLSLLELWSRQNPVTIGQLLPEHYWDRSALGWGALVTLRSQVPGARSRDWLLPGLSAMRRDRLRGGWRFPVVTLQPESIGQWAAAMAAVGEQQTVGVVLRSAVFQEVRAVQAPRAPLSAQELVQRFRGTASEKARQLVEMMAVLPVNWSVLRLLQKNLVEYTPQDTGALYLAEIFLSGLLRPLTASGAGKSAMQQYDFVEGVRDILLGAIPISEAQAVGEKFATEIFRRLPEAVQNAVNADIQRRFQRALSYFDAFLMPDLPWGETAQAEMLPFAQVREEVLQRWGGKYATLAEELKSNRGYQESAVIWQTDTVEVVTIEFSDELQLEPYEFEVATLQPVDNLLELHDLFKMANVVMAGRTGEGLTALQEEIIEGTWKNKSYGEIADREGLTTSYVSKVGAALFQSLAEELGVSISKKNMVAVFGQVANKPIKAGLQVVRTPGRAEQFKETLAPGVELEMVRIPAGEFLMGSPEDEIDRFSDEGPQRAVTVPEFYFGKYPVTQAQWRSVADLPLVERELKREPSRFKGDDLPVDQVSWFEAVEFCQRLSIATGREYHLPSAAEWEYAGRAQTTTPFHFGETISADLANYYGEAVYGSGEKGIVRGETTIVGTFNAANSFGLHDMHGNVWEWCLDHYQQSYAEALLDGSAWIDPNAERDARRELRGGSWGSNPQNCRSACRYNRYFPGNHSDLIGFRVRCLAARTS